MKDKNIPLVNVRIENASYNIEEDFFQADIYVSANGLPEKKVESYIDIKTFLFDTHKKNNPNLHFENFKDFSKNHNRKKPFYYENRIQYNNYQQLKKGLSYSFLNSCNCGIPYCSGIDNGVKFYKYDNHFIYHVGKKEGYKKGILDTGFRKIKISTDCIESIRKKIITLIQKD